MKRVMWIAFLLGFAIGSCSPAMVTLHYPTSVSPAGDSIELTPARFCQPQIIPMPNFIPYDGWRAQRYSSAGSIVKIAR